jgi:hypothetical protein
MVRLTLAHSTAIFCLRRVGFMAVMAGDCAKSDPHSLNSVVNFQLLIIFYPGCLTTQFKLAYALMKVSQTNDEIHTLNFPGCDGSKRVVKPDVVNVQMIQNLWVEVHQDANDARDVIVQLEDSSIFTALFVTPAYLTRQMELTYELARDIPDTVPVRFAALDTAHVLVPDLNRDTIEDTLDNLFAMDIFESVFTRVTEDEAETPPTDPLTTYGNGRRATQEVAAVVLQEVLVVE